MNQFWLGVEEPFFDRQSLSKPTLEAMRRSSTLHYQDYFVSVKGTDARGVCPCPVVIFYRLIMMMMIIWIKILHNIMKWHSCSKKNTTNAHQVKFTQKLAVTQKNYKAQHIKGTSLNQSALLNSRVILVGLGCWHSMPFLPPCLPMSSWTVIAYMNRY